MRGTDGIIIDKLIFADWVSTVERSMMREMLSICAQPDILSFALGLPSNELFPNQSFGEVAQEVLAMDRFALQLGPPFKPLKSEIVKLMKGRGVDCQEEQIFLTSGAQQGIDIIARMFMSKGRAIAVEEVSYTGFQKAVEPYQPAILTVKVDRKTGIDLDHLETIMSCDPKPAFLYLITDAHNPLGLSLELAKRKRLVEMARHYQVPIIEDDAYGFLYFEDGPRKPLIAMDKEWVIYVGTFSKILGPGLRTGWMIVPPQLISKLSSIKDLIDIDSCTFIQRVICAFLEKGLINDHLALLRREYRRRSELMLDAMAKYFPAQVKWERPVSGVFIWAECEANIDTKKLLTIALAEEKVSFLPGIVFAFQDNSFASRSLRLNFTYCKEDQIIEGIEKLARVINKALKDG